MILNAQNSVIELKNGKMDYLRFGNGERVMIFLPGVGDGFVTVKGKAPLVAAWGRSLAKDFTVYMFSRRRNLQKGITNREMAADLHEAMGVLGIKKASVVGVSQGGMISQWLAIDFPDAVENLVLVVTICKQNETVNRVISRWARMAKHENFKRIMIENAEYSYSSKLVNSARLLYGTVGTFRKPESYERFIIQARACLTHDTSELIGTISCPTLILGGTDDKIVSGHASEEIAELLPGSELYMYEGLGHGLYMEAPDFLQRISEFCK